MQMANSIFNILGGSVQPQIQAQNNTIMEFMKQVKNVQQSFRGDPREEVMKLINSGEMSQAKFNQLGQMANQLMKFM